MKLHLAGHLNWYDHQNRSWLEVKIETPSLLPDLLAQFGIPPGEVAIALLSGQPVDVTSAVLADTDVLELYPPSSGG